MTTSQNLLTSRNFALVSKAIEKGALINENLFLHSEIERLNDGSDIIAKSPEMEKILKIIDKAAASSGAVRIQGESGTGKELVARAVHDRSARKNNAFVAINCAGIPENLLESELFGHEAGAFTGATERKEGKFEIANGGTIFLDEIGSMSMNLQAKILRVLQEKRDGTKEFERVGSSKPISVDVRIISASNRDIRKAMAEGKFREDLFYRLNVIPISLPPLRDRKEDIPLLADHFLDKFRKRLFKDIPGIEERAMKVLISYDWPGNVRELKNIIERIVTIKQSGMITLDDMPVEILFERSSTPLKKAGILMSLPSAKDQLEKQLIKSALIRSGGNQNKAAKMLGIHRNTLFSKMGELGLKKEIIFGPYEEDPGTAQDDLNRP